MVRKSTLRLPWSSVLELYERLLDSKIIDGYAGRVIDEFGFDSDSRVDLIAALRISALYYHFGASSNKKIATNRFLAQKWQREGHVEQAAHLRLPPPNRPKQYSDQGLIWVLADAWEQMGRKVGTAFDWRINRDHQSPFARFCNGWIKQIDPGRRAMPSRSVYRRVLDQRLKAITRTFQKAVAG